MARQRKQLSDAFAKVTTNEEGKETNNTTTEQETVTEQVAVALTNALSVDLPWIRYWLLAVKPNVVAFMSS